MKIPKHENTCQLEKEIFTKQNGVLINKQKKLQRHISGPMPNISNKRRPPFFLAIDSL